MDKLVFKVHGSEVITGNVVRLPNDVIAIIQELQLETGLSASRIASEMIRFAKERVEIKGTQEWTFRDKNI